MSLQLHIRHYFWRHKQGLKQAAQLPAVFLSPATLLALRLTWLLHTVNQIKKAAGQEASSLWAGRWQVLFQLDSYSEYYLQLVQKYVFKKNLLSLFSIYSKPHFQNRMYRNHRIHTPFSIIRTPLPDYVELSQYSLGYIWNAINVSDIQTESASYCRCLCLLKNIGLLKCLCVVSNG